MMTTTLITSALIGRAPERSMMLGFACASMPVVHTSAPTATAPTATVPTATSTNLWLGGFQGTGFGSVAYATKRIHPGRLEGMT